MIATTETGRYGRRISFLGLVALLFASLSSGAGGIEEVVASSGPGMAMWLFLILPLVWALPNILVNAELSSAMPVEGGYYRWCRWTLGPFWGFVTGWWTWVGSVFDNILYPVIAAEYLGALWSPLSSRGARAALVLTFILLFGCLNCLGVRAVALSSMVFTALVLLPWTLFVLLAAPLASRNPFEPLLTPGRAPAEGLGVALVVAMWFFAGYELPSAAAEEYENSHRTLPAALLVLLLASTLSYVLPLAAGLAYSHDWAEWQDGSLAAVARQVGQAYGGAAAGHLLGAALAAAAAIAAVALFNGLLVPYSRILMVMAEEGDFPRLLALLHPRYHTPWVAIAFNCLLYAALHWLDFSELVLLSMWNSFAAYLAIDAALVVLRLRRPDLRRPFRIPGGAAGLAAVLVPLACLSGWAMWQSARENWIAANLRVLALGAAGLLSGPLIFSVRALVRRARRGATG